MSAPVLSSNDQKKALSNKKKKKKVVKNVLGIPSNLKIESCVVEDKETEKLHEILERLLPAAKLPVQAPKFKRKEEKEQTPEELQIMKQAKSKRLQLSLGVNEINKNLKKDLISAVLLANDIQPKFLIQHLNLLCTHHNIPFLQISKLRDITQTALGFPCIALGFKKNFFDFLEVINEIKSISNNLTLKKNESIEGEESSESDKQESDVEEEQSKSDEEVVFKYLYRTSNKERAFIPEEYKTDDSSPVISVKKSKVEFISVPTDDDIETTKKPKKAKLGISQNLISKEKMLMKNDLVQDAKMKDEDNLEVPKKKPRKDWVIDTVGTKRKFKYHSANLFKVHSNPKRN